MLDVVRKEAESCDCLQGALPNLVRALGGRAGLAGRTVYQLKRPVRAHRDCCQARQAVCVSPKANRATGSMGMLLPSSRYVV